MVDTSNKFDLFDDGSAYRLFTLDDTLDSHDSDQNPMTIQYVGTPAYGVGRLGKSLITDTGNLAYFDYNQGYFYPRVYNGSTMDAFSFSLWFKVAALPTSSAVIYSERYDTTWPNGIEITLEADGTVAAYWKWSNNIQFDDSTIASMAVDTWHNIVFSWDGVDQIVMRIDDLESVINTYVVSDSYAQDYMFGARSTSDHVTISKELIGEIDQIRSFSRGLDAADFTELYTEKSNLIEKFDIVRSIVGKYVLTGSESLPTGVRTNVSLALAGDYKVFNFNVPTKSTIRFYTDGNVNMHIMDATEVFFPTYQEAIKGHPYDYMERFITFENTSQTDSLTLHLIVESNEDNQSLRVLSTIDESLTRYKKGSGLTNDEVDANINSFLLLKGDESVHKYFWDVPGSRAAAYSFAGNLYGMYKVKMSLYNVHGSTKDVFFGEYAIRSTGDSYPYLDIVILSESHLEGTNTPQLVQDLDSETMRRMVGFEFGFGGGNERQIGIIVEAMDPYGKEATYWRSTVNNDQIIRNGIVYEQVLVP